jgi:DNA-directed RNA polymerase subunit alpha
VVQSVSPTIECERASDSYGRFIIEPLEPGFGITLGNALRRVLLSSLPGAAVTAVRIEGVQHEFSTIPHVKEDCMEFLLNIKGIRLRSLSEHPGKLTLEIAGEGAVCAGDIKPSPDFEIVNPELHLATLDSADAKLDVEFYVEQGKGYREAKPDDSRPIGLLPLDAIFTPIRRVNFAVEKARVGQVSNYDRLIFEVWTDGTISPRDALTQSARLLTEQFSVFSDLAKPPVIEAKAGPYDIPIEQLGLSSRTFNCLKRSKVTNVGQLLEKSREELEAMKGFGRRSLEEVWDRLQAHGFKVPEEEEVALPEEGEEAEAIQKLKAKFKVTRK